MENEAICLFEDHGFSFFGPLVDTRPVWELRCGAYTLGERLLKQFKADESHFKMRKSLIPSHELRYAKQEFSADTGFKTVLFLNGRADFDDQTIAKISESDSEAVFTTGKHIAAIRLSKNNVNKIRWNAESLLDENSIGNLKKIRVKCRLFQYPWELVGATADKIIYDLQLARNERPGVSPVFPEDVFIRSSDNIKTLGKTYIGPGAVLNAEDFGIRLEEGVTIRPGAVIDAKDGPVWIDENAVIMPGAVIIGPAYIGRNSIIRPLARLYGGVSFGPHCRVGGEVSSTVIIGYSSKQHSGYLGSSYVGEWVNFGAGTDNSDLKNNYKPVDVTLNKLKIDTGDLHVGAIVSDFCRTAIQTRLNSGTVAGICCNLFGPDFPSKYVPSYIWFGSDGYQEYRLDKALETIAAVMPRRGRELTPELETLLRDIFAESKRERDDFLEENNEV